jgi:N-terminal domain of anti-restriction factor ArdC
LRGKGIPYQGINVLMPWSAAMEKGYAAPMWMTFKQALELGANVRKGERGSLVVYANKIIRSETDTDSKESPGGHSAAQAVLSDLGLLRGLLSLSKERWRRCGIVIRKHVKESPSRNPPRPRNRGSGVRCIPSDAISGSGVDRERVEGADTVNDAPLLRCRRSGPACCRQIDAAARSAHHRLRSPSG